MDVTNYRNIATLTGCQWFYAVSRNVI